MSEFEITVIVMGIGGIISFLILLCMIGMDVQKIKELLEKKDGD